MLIRLIRSATVTITAGGATLLVDPWLAPKGGGFSYAGSRTSPLVDLPLPAEALLDGIDAVFVSHLHSDHFDAAAQRLLPRDLPLLCPPAIAARIRAFGFTAVTGIEGELGWRGWTLTLAGGQHGPDDVLAAMGEVHGFVVRVPGEPTLYWVGDSVWCPPVRETIERADPDVVVVHACGATWRGIGPLVMDGDDVVSVLRAAPRATVVATHLDAVDHATVSRADLRRCMASVPELAPRLRIPDDGEVITVAAAVR